MWVSTGNRDFLQHESRRGKTKTLQQEYETLKFPFLSFKHKHRMCALASVSVTLPQLVVLYGNKIQLFGFIFWLTCMKYLACFTFLYFFASPVCYHVNDFTPESKDVSTVSVFLSVYRESSCAEDPWGSHSSFGNELRAGGIEAVWIERWKDGGKTGVVLWKPGFRVFPW